MSPRYIAPTSLRVVAQAARVVLPLLHPCTISRANPAAPSILTLAKRNKAC